jgi:translocation and assembly module TamB
MLATAAIGIEDSADAIDVDLDVVLDRLANLPPGASELLGPRTKVQAKARFDQGEALFVLESLALDAEGVGLLGRGGVDIEQGSIESEVSVALPDLSAFDSLVEGGVAGAADLELQIGGTIEAPSVDLTLDGHDLLISGEAIRTLSLTADGRNLIGSPEGSIAVDLEAREVPASFGVDYRLEDQRLDLEKLLIVAPETEIGGDLNVRLDTGLIDGAVGGRISDLSALAPLIGQQLLGDIDVSATLLPDESEQGVSLSLKGRGIGGDFGRIEAITSDVAIADSFGDVRLNGKATVTGFQQGEIAVDAVTLKAEGDRERLGFQLKSAGEAFQPFDVSADGAIGAGDGFVVDFSRLEGAFAGEPVRLARPSTLRVEGERLSLSNLDLSLGEARLSGEVEVGVQAAKGTIDLRALPLSWSEIFGGPALGGRIDADIDLAGSAAEPKVTAAIAAIDVIGDDVTIDVAPIDITLDAQLENGRLAADLAATGLTEKPITANARMPVRLTLQPFSFETPGKGPLDGRIDIELQLARLVDLLALEGQKMAGLIDADLKIAGTLGEPRINGPIELTGASYENDASGTDIQDLDLSAVASTERIDIKSLSARTGKSGTLEANGWMELDSGADFPLSLRLGLDQARLVDLNEIESVISGDLTMTGNLVDPSIEGALNIDRAEIQIPDGGGADLPELDVEERGGNIVNPPEEEAADAEQSRPFDPKLGIGVTLPNKVYVRGRGLESEWQGDLRITGRASNPSIVGDLSIKKGYFDFLDKRFELEQGEISFSGETPPNPILALQAASEEEDFRAIIRLSGPANDPQILLESEPVLPDDEVLARLLFNRELSEIGPVEAGKLALAANRLRGGGGFDAFGEIRGLLKIDTLDVVSDDEGESRVRAGKYLGDDVYVEVEKGAADESGRARVEIELLPNIAVEAETSENADSGVGIKWKLDY